MDIFLRDIKFGIRMLLKDPGFTVVAVLALALGIGANTAIFSVVNSVLLRPLPYADSGQLVELREVKLPEQPDFPVTPATFLEWQRLSTSFSRMSAYYTTNVNLVGTGDPERLRGARVSAGLIDMLGIGPALGRDFLPDEDSEGSPPVAIISHRLWQTRLSGNPSILGQTVKLSGSNYTVVGVMPPMFAFPEAETEVWMPIAFDADDRQAFGSHSISSIGRLKPDATLQQARAEMAAIAERLAEQHPGKKSGWTVNVVPMLDYAVGTTKPALLILLGAVGFVLLIACANVANLMLARAAGRRREFAVRAALGSSRLRIVRQLLTESFLLAIIGGGAGLLLAVWGVEALLLLAPADLPRLSDVGIDSRALLFTLGITLVTALIFGLVPALQASRTDLNETLKDAGRGSSEGAHRHRVRNALVISELAISLVLLIGGGLLIRSFWKLQLVDPGFNPSNAVAVTVSLPMTKYAKGFQQTAFFEQLLQKVSRLPGVQTVGGTDVMPILNDFVLGVAVEGRPQDGTDLPKTRYFGVTPEYFKAMGIRLLRGREFNDHDRSDGQRVVIINQTMADEIFPGEDPIGKRIHITMGAQIYREIVGIVNDVKQGGLDKKTLSQTYEPFSQEPSTYMTLIVRSDHDPSRLVGDIRTEIRSIDQEQPIASTKTLTQIVSGSVAQQRFATTLMCVFALVAIVLAAVGLYGVMSYSVSQRTHEIGIRMALGAKPSDVLKMVVRQGALLCFAGVALGLGTAFGVSRAMSSLLFEISPTDPVTFASVAVLLTGVALAACLVPGRRATKVDPMVALRSE